jgi:hypothetical protein
MEDNRSLFSLSIDPLTKSNLVETARWARILAIVALVALVLVICAGAYQLFYKKELDTALGESFAQGKVIFILFYLLTLLVAFFPFYYILRFAGRMKTALAANDQVAFNESIQYLKLYFRFLGIVTLIAVVMVIISFLIGFLGVMTLAK